MEKVRRDSHSSESSEELEYAAQFANRMPDEDDDEDSPTADNNEEFPSSGVPDNIRVNSFYLEFKSQLFC